MPATFDSFGVKFLYPDNWTVLDRGEEEDETGITLELPSGGFLCIDRVDPASDAELLIDEGFARAWRVTGLALDRVGFAVEDRDRSDGTYYVRYNDPAARAKKEGWLSKLAFWSDDTKIDDKVRYRVKVDSSAQGSVITVLDDAGQRDLSTTAERILTLLHEQIQ